MAEIEENCSFEAIFRAQKDDLQDKIYSTVVSVTPVSAKERDSMSDSMEYTYAVARIRAKETTLFSGSGD